MDLQHRGVASWLAGSLLLLVLACDGSSSPTQPEGSLTFVTLLSGKSLGYSTSGEGEVIRDRGTWQSMWERLGQGGTAPAVDFSREMVLLVTGPGCCGDTVIRSVTQARGRMVVDVLAEASVNTLCFAADYSVHVVKVQRVSGAVDFVISQGEKRC